MEKIELKCSNCGGILNKIETQKDTYVCLHCGNKEIIKEEAKTTNYYINQNITKNIYGSEKEPTTEEFFKLIKNVEKFIKIEDYKLALKQVKQAKEIDAGNYIVWWFSAKIKLLSNIKNKENGGVFIAYSTKGIEDDYKKAMAFASEEERENFEEEYKDLYKQYAKFFEDANEYVEAQYGEEDKSDNKIASILMMIVAIISIIAGIFIALYVEIAAICLSFYGFIFFIIAISIYKSGLNNGKIINFIKSKEKLSFEEIYSFCEREKISLDYKDLNKKIAEFIENRNLTYYKIENGFIIRVK